MSNKIFAVVYVDSSVNSIYDFKLFTSFEEALRQHLRVVVSETMRLLSSSDGSSDNDEENANILQIFEVDGPEYKLVQEYDEDFFDDFIEQESNMVDTMERIAQSLDDGVSIDPYIMKWYTDGHLS